MFGEVFLFLKVENLKPMENLNPSRMKKPQFFCEVQWIFEQNR